MKGPLAILGLLALVACGAERIPLATMPAVSMTERSVAAGTQGEEIGEVEGIYCQGDDPIVSDSKNIGMLDEAIMQAQKQSGADYITGAQFFREGDCVVVTGLGMRATAGSQPTPDDGVAAAGGAQ
ncbi:MAG: hypothetical protein OXU20_14440 [Myxococcales bacterium]|nr:hypothetical protein [Myxococcales bacterium]